MKLTRLIEEYLGGILPDDKKAAFSERLKQEKELISLIRLHAEVNESIKDNELCLIRKLLVDVGNEYFAKEHDINIDCFWKIRPYWIKKLWHSSYSRSAAAVTLLMLTGLLIKSLFFHTLTSEVLYERYYSPYEADIFLRSADQVENSLIDALKSYQEGSYQSAYNAFSELSRELIDRNLAVFYQGLSSLGMKQYNQSVYFFSLIPETWEDPHVIHRDWYLALSLIQTHREDEAIEILVRLKSSESYYAKQASDILKRIKY